jgi:hypothetical protein
VIGAKYEVRPVSELFNQVVETLKLKLVPLAELVVFNLEYCAFLMMV